MPSDAIRARHNAGRREKRRLNGLLHRMAEQAAEQLRQHVEQLKGPVAEQQIEPEQQAVAKKRGPAAHPRRSTRNLKDEALAIMARPDLAPREKDNLLKMLRIECSLLLKANKEGPPPGPIVVEGRKWQLAPPSELFLERRARSGHYRPEVRARRAEDGRMAHAILAERRRQRQQAQDQEQTA